MLYFITFNTSYISNYQGFDGFSITVPMRNFHELFMNYS